MTSLSSTFHASGLKHCHGSEPQRKYTCQGKGSDSPAEGQEVAMSLGDDGRADVMNNAVNRITGQMRCSINIIINNSIILIPFRRII